jgi:hypothetical protein
MHESYPVNLPSTGKKRHLLNTENIWSIQSLSSNLPFGNSGVLVRQRTIPTKRPSLVGEVSANFSG